MNRSAASPAGRDIPCGSDPLKGKGTWLSYATGLNVSKPNSATCGGVS